MTELKMLLIQMTQAMRSQHEEIESLKKVITHLNNKKSSNLSPDINPNLNSIN